MMSVPGRVCAGVLDLESWVLDEEKPMASAASTGRSAQLADVKSEPGAPLACVRFRIEGVNVAAAAPTLDMV